MEDVAAEILMRLKEAGHKFTGKRKEIINLFVQNQQTYMTAKDIFDAVKVKHPNISVDTVYRTLALLQEHGVIEYMEFSDPAAKYRLTCQTHHHHHLICVNCGQTFTIQECPMAHLNLAIENFTVTDHRFEVYGYCASCNATP